MCTGILIPWDEQNRNNFVNIVWNWKIFIKKRKFKLCVIGVNNQIIWGFCIFPLRSNWIIVSYIPVKFIICIYRGIIGDIQIGTSIENKIMWSNTRRSSIKFWDIKIFRWPNYTFGFYNGFIVLLYIFIRINFAWRRSKAKIWNKFIISRIFGSLN